MATITELDHSSVDALLVDLTRHRNREFRFKYRDGSTTRRWRLVWWWYTQPSQHGPNSPGLHLAIEFIDGRNRAFKTDFFFLGVEGGWLKSNLRRMMVVLNGPPGSPSSAADSQQDRLDRNLRGIFS